MYISQNLRQSWYGNLLGDEENDEDQDTIKVYRINLYSYSFYFPFSVHLLKPIHIYL